jgi:hypothetical protein
MPGTQTLTIVSDIHYAGVAERARGHDYEFQGIDNPTRRLALKLYRDVVWLKRPLSQHHLLDEFLLRADPSSLLIANGDYSCNSAFVGISDDAACASARECLEKLRARFGPDRVRATIGDHELGKLSFGAGKGGMRLASFLRVGSELGLEPFWQLDVGRYALFGVASPLIALPVFEPDTLPEERKEWERLRELHLAAVRTAFKELAPDRRILLFCHDPTALPFLLREEAVRARLPQIEQTVIGHLHSPLIFWKSRLLAGMPVIPFGHSVRRMTRALREGRCWKNFHVRLCPSLAGLEFLKDGGYYTAELDPEARRPVEFEFHSMPR